MSKWFPMIAKSKNVRVPLAWLTVTHRADVPSVSKCDSSPAGAAATLSSYWHVRQEVGVLLWCVVCYPVSLWGGCCRQSVQIRCPRPGVPLNGAEIQALSVFKENLRFLIARSKWCVVNHVAGRMLICGWYSSLSEPIRLSEDSSLTGIICLWTVSVCFFSVYFSEQCCIIISSCYCHVATVLMEK